MRRLNDQFLADLNGGFLAPILDYVRGDRDIILEIRLNAINLYFKGNSLLKLSQIRDGTYKATIHPTLSGGVHIPDPIRQSPEVASIAAILPKVREAILNLRGSGSEIEYEQMIIRANNRESRLATDFLMVDRQICMPGEEGRFDLTGLYLPRRVWHRTKTAALALIETKFGLNPDIAEIHDQLSGYYRALANHLSDVAETTQMILRQKVKLGLISHGEDRLRAYQDLKVSANISDVRFVIALVDYAPESKLLNEAAINALPFRDQIDIFHLGFGLWQSNAVPRN